jgi:hypothetical protein
MTKFNSPLAKAFLLSGAIFIGWAAHAQSTDNNNISADSTHRAGMHHHDGFGRRGGSDGMAHRGGFRHHGSGIRYTPEQRKQVMAINRDYQQKAADLFKKDNITLREYKAGLIALQKDKKSQLQALLTPAQKDQIAKRRQQAKENAQVMDAARMERMKIHLNLSDEQTAKIKAGQEALHNKAKAIMENDDLLPQQKREQLKALASQRKDNLMAVLTPEQASKLQSMHQGMGMDHERKEWRQHDDMK